jgi:hypothetical protein
MRHFMRPTASALVALFAFAIGCGGRSNDTAGPASPVGGGNVAGSSGGGGSSGAHAMQGAGGAGGTGGTAASDGGAAGIGNSSDGGGKVASVEDGGTVPTCNLTPAWWPRSPFKVTMGSPSAEGAAGQSGAGGEAGSTAAGVSACSLDSPVGSTTTTCLGNARVVELEGATAFELNDGNVLSWSPVGTGSIPKPSFAQGRRVWLDYLGTVQICSFCGTIEAWTLSIRASETGDVLWLGRGGNVDDIDSASLVELLGAAEHRELACHVVGAPGCASFDGDLFNHVLETEHEQRLPFGMPTRVDTPKGAFDVMFATAIVTASHVACTDVLPPYGGHDFAASRVEQ